MIIYDLFIEQGATLTQPITVVGDFTGFNVTASLKAGDVFIPNFASWIDASIGSLQLDLTHAQTLTLDEGVHQYQVMFENTVDGSVQKTVKGRVYVDKGVTE